VRPDGHRDHARTSQDESDRRADAQQLWHSDSSLVGEA
jgi:hypothetical protein